MPNRVIVSLGADLTAGLLLEKIVLLSVQAVEDEIGLMDDSLISS